MKQAVVIIGIGEMAGVFARGFLRAGHPVYPVTRHTNMHELAHELPQPALVLVAVAEGDLHSTLDGIPTQWRKRLALLQNELLPRDWQGHKLENPTIISVWFEKKKGMDFKVIIPSPVYGPNAALLSESLATLGIPCKLIESVDELLYELVRKNIYILASNIAGLVTGGTVSELWSQHETLTRKVVADIITLQQWLTGTTLDQERLIKGMLEAFAGDPDHGCKGRSAPARLQRALQLAAEAGLRVIKLDEINQQLQSASQ